MAPCYNPKVNIKYKQIINNNIGIKVWKLNEHKNKTIEIGECLNNEINCDNYIDCELNNNLNIPIMHLV